MSNKSRLYFLQLSQGFNILDALSMQPLAAWWTRQLRRGADAFGIVNDGEASQSSVFFDNNGAVPVSALAALSDGSDDVGAQNLWDQIHRNDLGPATAFPKMFDGSTQLPVLVGKTQVMDFVGGVPGQYFDRPDVLGLEPDSGLTIAFKCLLEQPFDGTTFPTLLSLGTAATPELNVFFFTANLEGAGISVSNAADNHFVTWILPPASLLQWNSYVITKPAGSGGYSNAWKLYVNGIDQGPPAFVIAGGFPLGTTLTRVGDFGAAGGAPGGFPFVGRCAGIMVFGAVLDAADQALLTAFLATQ